MLADTLKAKERLTQEFGFDERRAKGIIELFNAAEDQVVTKEHLDQRLDALEQRMKKMMRGMGASLLAANAAITAALLALYGFAA